MSNVSLINMTIDFLIGGATSDHKAAAGVCCCCRIRQHERAITAWASRIRHRGCTQWLQSYAASFLEKHNGVSWTEQYWTFKGSTQIAFHAFWLLSMSYFPGSSAEQLSVFLTSVYICSASQKRACSSRCSSLKRKCAHLFVTVLK